MTSETRDEVVKQLLESAQKRSGGANFVVTSSIIADRLYELTEESRKNEEIIKNRDSSVDGLLDEDSPDK